MKWIGTAVMVGVLVLLAMELRELQRADEAGAAPPAYHHLEVAGRAGSAASIASHGNIVAVAWGGTQPDGAADVFAAVSSDGGRSFGGTVRVNDAAGTARISGEMAPRVAVRSRGVEAPLVDVVWTAIGPATTIRLAQSEDGGRTFRPSRALQADAAAGDRGWAALARGADGQIRAVWLDHRGMAADNASSGDHHHGHGSGAAAPHDGVAAAQKSSIYFSDGTVERAIASGVCYCCKTALAAAADGRILAAWRHVYAGNLRDIAFAASANGGLTFSQPVRVSEDEWQLDGCPDDGPAIAAGADGTVHLAWPTVVSKPEPHKAIFYASSRDGRWFTPRVRVSPAGRNVAHPQVAVGAEGSVALLWDEIVDGRRQVFLSRRNGGAFDEARALSRAQSASYPAAAYSADGLVVVWTEGAPASSRIAVVRVPRR